MQRCLESRQGLRKVGLWLMPSLLLAFSSLILSLNKRFVGNNPSWPWGAYKWRCVFCVHCLWAEAPMWKHLEDVLAEEKFSLSLGYCGGGGCMAFEMVKLDFCGSDAQRCLHPDTVWMVEQLLLSKDSFDCHTHRWEGSAGCWRTGMPLSVPQRWHTAVPDPRTLRALTVVPGPRSSALKWKNHDQSLSCASFMVKYQLPLLIRWKMSSHN